MALLMQDQFDSALLNLVNQERTSRDLDPLTLSGKLDAAADLQSRQMAQQDFFSHDNPITGSDIGSRARDQGYTIADSRWGVGENIAAGQLTPESVMYGPYGWMNSSGHRANILNPSYKHLGIGFFNLSNDTGRVNYNRYWTQVFGFGGEPGLYQAEMDSPPPPPGNSDLLEGTSAGDLLLGTSEAETLKGFGGNDTLKGAGGNDHLDGGRDRDRLIAGAGNDKLIGGESNDTLKGGGGNDRLMGVNPNASNVLVGKGEKDILIGNSGADTYVLGQNGKVFYDDRNTSTNGDRDYALIRGFNQGDGDRIQLEGRATDYVLGQSGTNLPSGTKVYLKNNNGPHELIGITQNVTLSSLTGGAFRFV